MHDILILFFPFPELLQDPPYLSTYATSSLKNKKQNQQTTTKPSFKKKVTKQCTKYTEILEFILCWPALPAHGSDLRADRLSTLHWRKLIALSQQGIHCK